VSERDRERTAADGGNADFMTPKTVKTQHVSPKLTHTPRHVYAIYVFTPFEYTRVYVFTVLTIRIKNVKGDFFGAGADRIKRRA